MTLALSITTAGLARLTAASGTNAVTIATMGLTATPFTPAPTLTALPGQFKAITGVGGAAIDSTTIHLVALDNSADAYAVTGFGLFLADGTLFATYSQADALIAKISASTLWFAHDIKLQGGAATSITFGPTSFLNPPASEAAVGVLRLASLAEVAAGVEPSKAVTPAGLAPVLAGKQASLGFTPVQQGGGAGQAANKIYLGWSGSRLKASIDAVDLGAIVFDTQMNAAIAAALASLVNGAPGALDQLNELAAAMGNDPNFATTMLNALATKAVAARQILTSGLATGGGDLTGDRTIDVARATQAEVDAGATDVKAITPFGLAPLLARVAGLLGRTIGVGGLATGGGDLSASRTITVPKASQADAAAGTDDAKALTPFSIAGVVTAIYAAIAGKVAQARQVLAGGLATGGGALTGDVTITVAKAAGSDVTTGTDDAKALTSKALRDAETTWGDNLNGGRKLPGGRIEQWMVVALTPSGTSNLTQSFSFPVAFPNACQFVGGNADKGAAPGSWNVLVLHFPTDTLTATGGTVIADSASSSTAIPSGRYARIHAIGR